MGAFNGFDYRPIQDSAKALEVLVKEAMKPWYKKPEAWFALIAAIGSMVGLIFVIIKN